MAKDLVSIIIPCYNSEKYIGECLDSILEQTYKKLEVIIVNDGSSDKTKEILNLYKKKFIETNIILKIIDQENQGQASAVNNGLKYVTGEYLMWQDSDDCYTSEAVEQMLLYLKVNKEKQFVRGEALFLDESMNKILEHKKSKYPNDTNIFDFFVFETDSYCYPGVFMIRMEYFDKCIKDREIFISEVGQNWQLILPIAYKGECGYLDKIVYKYRIREDSHYHSVKKIEELINRTYGYEKLLFKIIDYIDMPIDEKINYKKLIKRKYDINREEIYIFNFDKIRNVSVLLQNYFNSHNIKKLIIYGMGNMGKKLYEILAQTSIDIIYAVDKNSSNIKEKGIKIINLENASEKADAVIITPVKSCQEILELLREKDLGKTIVLKDIVDFCVREGNRIGKTIENLYC